MRLVDHETWQAIKRVASRPTTSELSNAVSDTKLDSLILAARAVQQDDGTQHRAIAAAVERRQILD